MSFALVSNPISQVFADFKNSAVSAFKSKNQSKAQKAFKARGFVSQIIDFGKSLLKIFVQSNPLSIFLTSLQKRRSNEALLKAKNRHNFTTPDELEKYHQSLEFDEVNNPKGLFQFYQSTKPGPKTQVVLIMGRGQGFMDKEDEVGLLKIYKILAKENNADVLLFRAGSAIEDLKHRYGFSDDTQLKPEIVKEHIKNLIEDRLKQEGKFQNSAKARNLVIVGYSWGGGLLAELLDDWSDISSNTPVSKSITLDAIEYGCQNFGDELKERPKNSQKHINIFQSNDTLLTGSNLQGMKEGDEEYNSDQFPNSNCPDHRELDDCKPVLDKVLHMIIDDIAIPETKRELRGAA